MCGAARLLICACLAFWPAISLAESPVIDAVIYTTRGEIPLKLEVAADPATRERGLMERRHLTHDGMIFLFPDAQDYAFWMKNTPLPLDMLFVTEKHSIAAIAADTAPYSLNLHRAGKPVTAVIELDAGRAAGESIEVGDKVRYAVPTSLEIR